uniref:Copia protein n=1 Tax=Tanacetum cinerariifolium TaxID=118510 RepID=A0A6L2MNP4_TANCI|nr:hypothetical protein [Tanacetum cinerariifolium]
MNRDVDLLKAVDEEQTKKAIEEPERYYGFVIGRVDLSEPITYHEAVYENEVAHCQDAIKTEMQSMYDNQVWELVDLPLTDIAYVIILTSMYQTNPGVKHRGAVKNILTYFKRTKDHVEIFCDNIGALAQDKEPIEHHKTKHILCKFHILREIMKRGYVTIKMIPTEDNDVDPLIKPLPHDKHYRHAKFFIMKYID